MSDTLNALVEAADKLKELGIKPVDGVPDNSLEMFETLVLRSAPALRATLARDAALEQYIAELHADRGATEGYDECASRLEQIMKGEK